VGPFSTLSGLGEAARNCTDAIIEGSVLDSRSGSPLRDVEPLRIRTFDVSRRLNQDSTLPTPPIDRIVPIEIGRPRHSLTIVHANGPLMPWALIRLGEEIRDHRVIGRWAWELPVLPPDWRVGLRYVHEIWALSTFTARAIGTLATCPVRVMPIPIKMPDIGRLPPAPWRKPAATFAVFTTFNMASSFARKNPLAAVEAFRLAFERRSDVRLVIKTSNLSVDPKSAEDLLAAIGNDTRIVHIDHPLDREQMYALIRECDVTLSLHRSEGFGMPLAESMLLGRATVATGWSGNLDFMNDKNSLLVNYTLVPARDRQRTYDLPDAQWADPDVEHAAIQLRRLFLEPDLKGRIEAKALRDVAAHCAPEAHWRRVLKAMDAV
jgi:glycosyltransferase involved in cell wall biosynthesis